MKKSQVSTEFMFFVGAAFVLLIAYLIISYSYLNLTFKRQDIVSATNLLEELRNELNLAARVENGYNRIITLPKQISKRDYTININNREVNIKFDEVDYVRLLATKVTVTGTAPAPGDIILIKKENNQVTIEKKT